MPKGHHFTHCRYCNKEYVCGDCITDNCEMGHGKKSCPGYKLYLRQEHEAAKLLQNSFENPNKRAAAGARLLADFHWDRLVLELSDSELADALLKEVWAYCEIGTMEGAILSEAIERLRKSQLSLSHSEELKP